jgi:hypothetical protein
MAIDAAHAEFVRDCWRYLQASAPRWARYSRQWPEFTALECDLVMEAAYTRLARARRASEKDDAADIIFNVPLRDVNDATWRAFVRRASPIDFFYEPVDNKTTENDET